MVIVNFKIAKVNSADTNIVKRTMFNSQRIQFLKFIAQGTYVLFFLFLLQEGSLTAKELMEGIQFQHIQVCN